MDGSITLVGGPLEFDTRRIDLWVSDLITIALPKLTEQERGQINCATGRFDLVNGIAASDGFVREIDVQVGQAVDKGQVLVVLENESLR